MRVHVLTSKDTDDIISHFLVVDCANSQFVYIIKSKLHSGLKILILILSVNENIKFLFS